MNTVVKKRRWLKGIAFVLVFLLIGGVIGAGATLLLIERRMPRGAPQRDAIVNLMLDKMRERVPVSDEEAQRLTALLEDRFDEILGVREESFRSMQGVFENMDADIRSVLGPERFQTWYDYKEERMARWRERYGRHPQNGMRGGNGSGMGGGPGMSRGRGMGGGRGPGMGRGRGMQ